MCRKNVFIAHYKAFSANIENENGKGLEEGLRDGYNHSLHYVM